MKGESKMRLLIGSISWFLTLSMLTLSAWGTSDKAWIGIYTQTIDEDLQEAFELDSDDGVIIEMVVPESPGEKAGLGQGDIILSINGEKIVNSEHLSDYIAHLEPGEKISIDIIRDDKHKEIILELGKHEPNDTYFKSLDQYHRSSPKSYSKTFTFNSDDNFSPAQSLYLGVNLQGLNEQLGEYFGVEKSNGALITEVIENSPAEKIGLKAGDVIIEIDQVKISEYGKVSEIIRDKEEGDEIQITVLRNKKEKEFSVNLENAPDGYFSNRMPGNFPGIDEDFFFNLPKMKGLSNGNFDFHYFDQDDNQEDLSGLKNEINELKKQIEDIQKKIE